jgi:hypothetical protein
MLISIRIVMFATILIIALKPHFFDRMDRMGGDGAACWNQMKRASHLPA